MSVADETVSSPVSLSEHDNGCEMNVPVVLEPSDEGGFTVWVPSLPGCISEGDSREEALDNIREAIALYLESTDDAASRSPDAELVHVAV